MFHDVVSLGVGQGVISLPQVPLPGEVGPVSGLLENRCKGPFRRGQATSLALEGHRGHAAAVGDAPGLHGRTARRTAGLRVKGEKGHPVCRHAVETGGGHAASLPTAVGPEVAIAGVIGHDQKDVRFFVASFRRQSRTGDEKQNTEEPSQ